MLAFQSKMALCEAATPAPEPIKVIINPGALLDTDTVPLNVAELVGVNITFTCAVWLGVSVIGADAPLLVKSAPVSVMALILTLVLPELTSVTDCWLLLPSGTELKFRLPAVLVRTAVDATPIPVSAIDVVGPATELVASTKLPGIVPADFGLKFTLNVLLLPAPIVSGVFSPLRV